MARLTESEDLIKIEHDDTSISLFKGHNMKRIHKISIFFLAFSLFIFTSYSILEGQPEIPETKLPVLITSCGQSTGPIMLKVVFMKLKLEAEPKAYEVIEIATAEDLKTMKEAGTPYKSIIITMGASLKGMGAAGISIDDELSRTSKLIEEARIQGITIIGAHIEGTKRRAQGAAVGDNTDELSIDAVAPNSDLLVIRKEGNQDRRFTIIAEEKNIPMIEVEKNLELIPELKKLFTR
jgi:uncharacterized protein with PQ loop repeat